MENTDIKLNLAKTALRNLLNFEENVIDLRPLWMESALESAHDFKKMLEADIKSLEARKKKEESRRHCDKCGHDFVDEYMPNVCPVCLELYNF